jgi:beta-phosphoglucomutase-like phosphatase (HAD superfamily)
MAETKLRGAIFDVDGVLVDSPHERAWRESLDALMRGPWSDVASQTRWHPGALTGELYAAEVAGKPREDGARAALEALGIPDGERVRQYSEAKQERVQELIDQHAFRPFDDGVALLLLFKDAGLRLAAASSSRNAPALLQKVRLDEWCAAHGESYPFVRQGTAIPDLLDADLSGRRFPHGKPDPAIFLAAAEALGLEPAACVVVEDAPNGVAAAKAGGMRSIGVDRADDADDLRAHGATWVVRDLREALPELPLAG